MNRINEWTRSEKKTLVKCLEKNMSAIETANKIGRTTAAIYSKKFAMVEDGEISGSRKFRNHNMPKPVVKKSVKKATAKATLKPKAVSKKKAASKR